ncbi:MAG: MFS transporter, partial [Streptosporangiaceae bacterium]
MTTEPAGDQVKKGDDAGIWITLRESPLAVKAMLAGVFVNRLGGFILVFLVLYMVHRGFSTVEAGAALSAYGGGAVLGVLIGGSLSDQLGPRRATLISMFGTAALAIAILYLRSYLVLVIMVALIGAVGVVFRPGAAALMSELTPKHRQVMIMGLYRMAFNVGTTAAPLIGAALFAISWNLLFWGEAVASLAYGIIAVFTIPQTTPVTKPKAATETLVDKKGQMRGFFAVLSDRRFAFYVL